MSEEERRIIRQGSIVLMVMGSIVLILTMAQIVMVIYG